MRNKLKAHKKMIIIDFWNALEFKEEILEEKY
jgi:hypothetical protein